MATKEIKGLSSFGSISSLGSAGSLSDGGLGGSSAGAGDLTIDELLSIAQAQGGAVGQRAMELAHPERSILSTIGSGFKSAFKGFVDTISIPGEIVAGMISPDFTVAEAIKEHKRVSDAIFGDTNLFGGDTPTTMQKIGNFVVRLPVDILGDPLTYFGKLPFATFLPKVDLGVNAIKELGFVEKAAKAGGVISREVTPEGNHILGYLKNLQRQLEGKTGIELLEENLSLAKQKAGLLEKGFIKESELDFTEKQLKELLKKTTEAPINIDWSKRAVTMLMEKSPALINTIIDKGGIKYLGKTLLSAQRINAVKDLIPGMTMLDDFTTPLRMSLASKFDPSIKPLGGGKFMRLPEEAMQVQTHLRNLEAKMSAESITELQNMQKQLNLLPQEIDDVYSAALHAKPPSDPRLYKAYLVTKGINDKNKNLIEGVIGTFGRIENHIGNMFNQVDTRGIASSNSKLASEIGSAKQAGYATYVLENSDVFKNQMPDINKILGLDNESGILGGISKSSIFIDGGVGTMHGLNPNKWGDYNHTFLKAKEFGGTGSFQDIGLEINGVEKLTTEKVLATYKKYGVEVDKSKYFTKTAEGEATLAIRAKGKVSDEVMHKIATELEQDAIPQFVRKSEQGTKYSNKFLESVNNAKTTQEVGYAIGHETEDMVQTLMSKGMTMENALKADEVKELFKMREQIGKLTQSPSRTGTMEEFGLTGEKVSDIWNVVDEDGKTYKRVQAHAKDLINKYGFDNLDTNLLTIMVNQSLRNQKQLVGQYYMEGMVRQFARLEGEAGTDGWKAIDSGALENVATRIGMPLVTKDGQQYVFHPAVAADFEEMLKGFGKEGVDGDFWKNFDKIQRYWKASVTSIFPMFHGRNAISNVLQNFMDIGFNVFNPETNIMSSNIIYNDRIANGLLKRMSGIGDDALKATTEHNTLMAKVMFEDKSGYDWRYGELRSVMKENDIAFNPDIVGMMDVAGDPQKMLSQVFRQGDTTTKKILRGINPTDIDTNIATRTGRQVGKTIEEYSRTLNFITNLKNTGDVLHAAARTKMFLFDYQHLTKFEKNTMRRLIPFYTWTRKNLELQARILMSAPGRISNELTAINSIGDLFGGGQLSDKEKSLLPSWMANTIALKREGKNGNAEILSGFGTPIEQPFQALQPNSILGSISPLFRYPIEAMSGYQFFQGKLTSSVIDAQNYDNAPDVIKQFIGWGKYEGKTKDGKTYSKSYSLNPANMHMLNNLPFVGRVGNVFGQMTNANTATDAKLLQLITGVNVRSYNFENLQAQQEALLESQIQQAMTDAGVAGQFKRFYLRKNTQQVAQ